jgi:hypothetical protein
MMQEQEQQKTLPLTEMPQYRCQKVVRALQIGAMEIHKDDSATIVPQDDRYPQFTTREGFAAGWKATLERTARMSKDFNDPGYFVMYDDGYTSWSPTAAFEKGYARVVEDTPFDPEVREIAEGLYEGTSVSTNLAEQMARRFGKAQALTFFGLMSPEVQAFWCRIAQQIVDHSKEWQPNDGSACVLSERETYRLRALMMAWAPS